MNMQMAISHTHNWKPTGRCNSYVHKPDTHRWGLAAVISVAVLSTLRLLFRGFVGPKENSKMFAQRDGDREGGAGWISISTHKWNFTHSPNCSHMVRSSNGIQYSTTCSVKYTLTQTHSDRAKYMDIIIYNFHRENFFLLAGPLLHKLKVSTGLMLRKGLGKS